MFAIFDRSWYGRVLVERVENFATASEWSRAYQEIREFEEHLTNAGTIVLKFWLHISKEEQLRRFKERQRLIYKNYKITNEDWRNRKKWQQYFDAVADMIEKTNTAYAPWIVVEGNSKWWARVRTVRAAVEHIESQL
jgi:polyphosphate kinase 2 (PPK2 family)